MDMIGTQVRIFPANEGRSREVYHSKRMQRIFAVKFSADNKYVLSGSDDTNIRCVLFVCLFVCCSAFWCFGVLVFWDEIKESKIEQKT